MHIEYLYYFRDFSKTLSISKTAAMYYMTPQGLSRALHQMEKDFGVDLMTYHNNAVSLTPAGNALASRIDGITELYDEMKGSLLQYKLSEVMKVNEKTRIITTSCASQYLLSMLDLQKPGLFPFNVNISESNLYRFVPVVSEDCDNSFGLVSLPTTQKYYDFLDTVIQENGMKYIPLCVSPLVALVSTYSPLAKLDTVDAQDVTPYPVARFRDTVLGDALDDFISRDNIKTVTNAASVIYSQIIEHQAVGFAPKIIEGMRTLPRDIVTKPVDGFFDTEFGILARSNSKVCEKVVQVVCHAEETLIKEKKGSRYGDKFDLLF